MKAIVRRLYDWMMGKASHRHSISWLAVVSFIESSIFPIPPDVLLIPMILAQRARAWVYATICTMASVIGGIVGYGIGILLFKSIGRPIMELYGYSAEFDRFRDYYDSYGAWIVVIFAVTFLPYKVVTIASGVAVLEPFSFILASVLGRGIRFFTLAVLLWYFGMRVRAFIEARLGLVMGVFVALLVAGFFIVKFSF